LRLFIDWVSFNADYLNSVWVAAIPAFVGAAAISYFVPSQLVQRTWTSWLLIVPIAGLIVLGSSLMQYFVR
jgi:type II secretory pathway component PulF